MDNIEGKITRIPPIIINGSGAAEDIHGYIQQLEIFDMDHDGKTDIVTLDDNGEINILYGTVREVSGKQEHIFTKKLIENGLGVRLSKEIRNDDGAFSYTGLVFPNQGTASTGKNFNPDGLTGAVNQGMIDNIIYYQYNYQSDTSNQTSGQIGNVVLGGSFGANMKRNPDGTYAKDAAGNYIDDAGSMSYNAMSGSSLTGSIDYTKAAQNSVLQNDISQMIEETQLLAGS